MYVVGIIAKKPGMRLITWLPPLRVYLAFLAQQLPEIPLEAYRLCMITGSPRFQEAYVSLSLSFGNLLPIFSENLR
jgi:hypothetical protein